MATKKEKAAKGMGHLYKRDSRGRECPASSKKKGTFWLAWREGGKRKRVRLEVDGAPVTDLETARREQLRLRAPYLTGQRIEVLKSIRADIERLEEARADELDMADPPLALADAWRAMYLLTLYSLHPQYSVISVTVSIFFLWWGMLLSLLAVVF